MRGIDTRKVSLITLPLIAALANWLAQPNEIFLSGSWIFGLVSFIPLYMLFREVAENKKEAGISGLIYAASSTLSSYFWLKNFGEYSLWTIGGVLLVYLVYYWIFFRLLHYLLPPDNPAVRIRETNPFRKVLRGHEPLVFAAAWTAFELFRSRGYLAFPWNLAAHPFNTILVLNQVVELAGVWIISFLVFLFQGSAAELIHEMLMQPMPREKGLPFTRGDFQGLGWGYRFLSVATAIIFMIYGTIRIQEVRKWEASEEGAKTMTVLLVQQNIDSMAQEIQGNTDAGLKTAIDLSMAGISKSAEEHLGTPDLIAWSETSLTYPYSENARYFDVHPSTLFSFRDFLNFNSADFITGAPIYKSYKPFIAYNGSIYIDRDGRLQGEYGKMQLIPFAESIPFTDFKPLSDFLQNVIGLPPLGWTPGPGIRLFTLSNGVKAGTPICFEDSFSHQTRLFIKDGADILLNLTNNAWSETRSAQLQHLVAARYRAIENRRFLLRSTNGGVTCIIRPDGSIQSEIPMFEPDFLLDKITVHPGNSLTFFTVVGDWFAWFAVLLLFVIVLMYSGVLPQSGKK